MSFKFKDIYIGQTGSLQRVITEKNITDFEDITRDNNSIHKQDGVVYGMLIASYMSALIGNQLPGDGAVWISNDITFVHPVFRRDMLYIEALVVSKEEATHHIRMYIDVYNQNKVLCVSSVCWVKVPE